MWTIEEGRRSFHNVKKLERQKKSNTRTIVHAVRTIEGYREVGNEICGQARKSDHYTKRSEPTKSPI